MNNELQQHWDKIDNATRRVRDASMNLLDTARIYRDTRSVQDQMNKLNLLMGELDFLVKGL